MLAHKLKNSTREQDWWMPDKTFRGQVHSSECWNQAQIIVHSTNKCSTTSWSCWKLVGPKLWEVWLKAQHRTLLKWSKKGLVAETKTKNPVRPLISAGGKVCLGVEGGITYWFCGCLCEIILCAVGCEMLECWWLHLRYLSFFFALLPLIVMMLLVYSTTSSHTFTGYSTVQELLLLPFSSELRSRVKVEAAVLGSRP